MKDLTKKVFEKLPAKNEIEEKKFMDQCQSIFEKVKKIEEKKKNVATAAQEIKEINEEKKEDRMMRIRANQSAHETALNKKNNALRERSKKVRGQSHSQGIMYE